MVVISSPGCDGLVAAENKANAAHNAIKSAAVAAVGVVRTYGAGWRDCDWRAKEVIAEAGAFPEDIVSV